MRTSAFVAWPLCRALLLVAALTGAAATAGAAPAAEGNASTAEQDQVDVPNDWKVGDGATYRFIRIREETGPGIVRRAEQQWLLDIDVLEARDTGSVHRWHWREDPTRPNSQTLPQDPAAEDLLKALVQLAPELTIDADGKVTGIRNLSDVRSRLMASWDRETERAGAASREGDMAALRRGVRKLFENDAYLFDQLTRESRLMYSFGGGGFLPGTHRKQTDRRVSSAGQIPVTVEVESWSGTIGQDRSMLLKSVERALPQTGERLAPVISQAAKTGGASGRTQQAVVATMSALSFRVESEVMLLDGSPWLPSMSRTQTTGNDQMSRVDTSRLMLVSRKSASK